jgi:hypothetical protein
MSMCASDGKLRAEILDDLFRAQNGKPLRKRKCVDGVEKEAAKKPETALSGEPKLRCCVSVCKAYCLDSKNRETCCRFHTGMSSCLLAPGLEACALTMKITNRLPNGPGVGLGLL